MLRVFSVRLNSGWYGGNRRTVCPCSYKLFIVEKCAYLYHNLTITLVYAVYFYIVLIDDFLNFMFSFGLHKCCKILFYNLCALSMNNFPSNNNKSLIKYSNIANILLINSSKLSVARKRSIKIRRTQLRYH